MLVAHCLKALAALQDLIRIEPVEVSDDELQELLYFLAVPNPQYAIPSTPQEHFKGQAKDLWVMVQESHLG